MTARQAFKLRRQVVAEEADQTALKGRKAWVGLIGGLGKLPPFQQSFEDL